MGEKDVSSVATAIRAPEFEGFVAGTLFDQGWNVSYRALDIPSLISYLDNSSQQISLLLISTDVEGLTPEKVDELSQRGIKLFLFAATSSADEMFPEAISPPATSLDLLGLIRGSLRAPMIRGARKEKIRAKTIAISSPHSSSGCTTMAINLGTELGQLGYKVLIVDAHAYFPAFAIRLGERGLNTTSEPRNLSDQLWALEVAQADVPGAIASLERARMEFDFIVIDHGPLRDFPAILTGRRWCSEIFIWSSTFADELWLMCKGDNLSLERLRILGGELLRNSIKPEITFIQCMSNSSKRIKSESENFLQLVTPMRPMRVVQSPWDQRGVTEAESGFSTLFDTNERGILRKFIAQIAGELTS